MDNLSTWEEFFTMNSNQINPVANRDSKDRRLLMRMFHHKHMVETIERFEWKNLPPELPSDIIERVLYFRFKGALFKFNGRFVFLPFTLKGQIDSYGRYESIMPVLFTGQWKTAGDGKMEKDISFMADKTFIPVYDMPYQEGESSESEKGETQEEDSAMLPDAESKAVILTDSTLEISQDFTPMAYMIRPIVEQLVDILVLVNIDLITSAKHFYIVAKDSDQKDAIEKEFANLDTRILNGKRYTVVTSPTDLKELTGSSPKDTARYFQSFQSVDNLRKEIIGLDNGGTFMKQEHTTDMEMKTNSTGGSFVLNNALRMRQDFCEIANHVFGTNIQVDMKNASESNVVAPEGQQSQDLKNEEGEE